MTLVDTGIGHLLDATSITDYCTWQRLPVTNETAIYETSHPHKFVISLSTLIRKQCNTDLAAMLRFRHVHSGLLGLISCIIIGTILYVTVRYARYRCKRR